MSKRKRTKTASLNLEDVLASSRVNEKQTLGYLNKLQEQLAEVDLINIMSKNAVSEDMMMLWLASKIGFSNASFLQQCVKKVPRALLTHRRKYILDEFKKLSGSTLSDADVYIDLMQSCSSNVKKPRCEEEPTTVQRFVQHCVSVCVSPYKYLTVVVSL